MTPASDRSIQIERRPSGLWAARFAAMASPCEILIDSDALSESDVATLVQAGAHEAWRVEQKYSRYRDDNIVYRINNSQGEPVSVDEETAELLDYADTCYELSGGLFDVSSGPLRRVWRFDGRTDATVNTRQLQNVMQLVGWHRCLWQKPTLTLPAGAEIDFGGMGKEYAVDRTVRLLQHTTATSGVHDATAILVNFGGDLACLGSRPNGAPWHIGMESISRHSPLARSDKPLALASGALATSGDTYRYLYHQGKRLSHVLNPRTGYPVEGAPQSVTVAAQSCTLAGMLATFAMLHGTQAEAFLQEQQVHYWIQRSD